MKRVFKISDSAHPDLPCLHKFAGVRYPTRTNPLVSHRKSFTQSGSSEPSRFSRIISLFMEKVYLLQDDRAREEVSNKVSQFRDELLRGVEESDIIDRVLDDKGHLFFQSYADGYAFVELLQQLDSWPQLALKVLDWRRKQSENGIPMISEEYSKGIKIAGSIKNVDLAVELFTEAEYKRLKTTSTYNALMGAYMVSGLGDKCQAVFRDLKRDPKISPSVVTYNILISVFGRLMLVDHMEATFGEIEDLNFSPNLCTYNNLIAGYVTAWMWDSMEKTFQRMKADSVEPDINTHLLLLRGYAHSGNLEKMEEIYSLVEHYVNDNEISLIRTMICAYCKSKSKSRVEKIQALIKLIPQKEYRPWLNVLLIKVFAQEDLIEGMENSINEAFERDTSICTMGVMRSIVGSYFRCNAIDRLANFVKRAECAGWRICRSLYHGKMVMYAAQNRLEEMEGVLNEMENINIDRTKKTYCILYKAYSLCGQRYKVEQVMGLMCKHGYGIPSQESSS